MSSVQALSYHTTQIKVQQQKKEVMKNGKKKRWKENHDAEDNGEGEEGKEIDEERA